MESTSEIFLMEQLSLIAEQEIGKKMDSVIPEFQKIAKIFTITEKDEKSPFRNVLAVANESGSSIEVIKNYIRYQVGRRGASEIWRQKNLKDKKLFATAVVEQIDSLSQEAQNIVDTLRKTIGYSTRRADFHNYLEDAENREQLKKNIHLKLTQLYLGYLAREHTALLGEKNAKKDIETKSRPHLTSK
ncbi:hypothetical protein BCD67_20880 [Oscillatoriales cyanobacterium USR001]|nr:hypothetical protein BCD67_20880 [Oscillatoriales cyanobacterium USR001]